MLKLLFLPLIVFLRFVDLFTTYLGISEGSTERNFLSRFFIEKLGWTITLFINLLLLIPLFFVDELILLFIITFDVFVLFNNFTVLEGNTVEVY